ncbi:MAG TPA: 3D domain-containing protein [Thermoclostridium sp.]|nr:3D domain-containing protein [Thermoclostridium sp.]
MKKLKIKSNLPPHQNIAMKIANFIKRYTYVFILIATITISITIGYNIYDTLKKDIKVVDGESEINISTMGEDLKTAFEQAEISVESYDYISSPLSAKLSNDDIEKVQIKRAVPVDITVDGNTTEVMTYLDTVAETIKNNGIVLAPLDKVEGTELDDPISAGMEIKIVRVKEEVLTELEDIPYAIEETPNEKMNQGEKKLIQAGIEGILEKNYKLTYEDGVIKSREFMEEKIIEDPIIEKTEYGIVPNFQTSRGELVRYSKVLDMRATAYTASFEDTGKHPDHPQFGICYTGMKAREGVIAVDPKVIPLHTRLYVEIVGDTPDYGFAYAGDIGSAIKGDLIDLYLDTSGAVRKWGVKKVRVYILNEQNDNRWKETDYIK